MNVADELQKLQQLHQSGAINDGEFDRAKAKLLNEETPVSGGSHNSFANVDVSALEQQTRQWALILHLSQFAGYVVPVAGLILPIVLWQLKKEELPGIDAHGKVVVNWIISEILYAAGCLALAFLFIGVPLLIVVGVLGIIFPIIAAIKANDGEVWPYPLSISFLS